jgi:hypothetical protein
MVFVAKYGSHPGCEGEEASSHKAQSTQSFFVPSLVFPSNFVIFFLLRSTLRLPILQKERIIFEGKQFYNYIN